MLPSPPARTQGKRKSLATFPKNIHICNSWTEYYKIFQRTFPLCAALIKILFYFYAWKAFTPGNRASLSQLGNKVLTFFQWKERIKDYIEREHHFHTGVNRLQQFPWDQLHIFKIFPQDKHCFLCASLFYFLSGQVSTLHIPRNLMDAELDQMMKW